MCKSCLVVPLVSWDALKRMTVLAEGSPCDNVVLEWTLAVELTARFGTPVYPVLIGPRTTGADGTTTMQNLFAARPPKLSSDGLPARIS